MSTQPRPAKHDPRTCQPCASLRHPGLAKAGRQLTAHPLPRQAATA